jgi:hypothetical protein
MTSATSAAEGYLTAVDWSQFGIRPSKPKAPKEKRGRPPKRFEPGSQELKDKEFETRQLKRAKEKYEAAINSACTEYPEFGKWIRTLEREEPLSAMPRNGYLDWDATELSILLKLTELPEEIRRLAFTEFARLLRRVTKRKYGDECGPLLPFEEWAETDFEQMKRTLRLT